MQLGRNCYKFVQSTGRRMMSHAAITVNPGTESGHLTCVQEVGEWWVNKTVSIVKKADRTAYNVWYSCRTEPPTCRCDIHGKADVITLFTSHVPAASTAELSYRFVSLGLFCG